MRLFKNKKTALAVSILFMIALIFITRFLLTDRNNTNDYLVSGKDGEHPTVYDVNYLFENKTQYIGNHVKVGILNKGLPFPEGLTRGILELATDKPPYKATYHYHLTADSQVYNKDGSLEIPVINEEQFLRNSILLFALIDNAEEITHLGHWNNELLSSIPFSFTYTRADAEKIVGSDVRQFAQSKEKLTELIEIVEMLKDDDMEVAIDSITWWKLKYPVIKDVKFHVLIKEYLVTNDKYNPDTTLLVRKYMCFDGTAEEWNQAYPVTNKIALPKSDTITTALGFKNELKKLDSNSSLELPPNTIISNNVLKQWVEEKYAAVFEYSDESPSDLTYELLLSLVK